MSKGRATTRGDDSATPGWVRSIIEPAGEIVESRAMVAH